MPISDTQALLSFMGACNEKTNKHFQRKVHGSLHNLYTGFLLEYIRRRKSQKAEGDGKSMLTGYALKARLTKRRFRHESEHFCTRLVLESLIPESEVNTFHPNKCSWTFRCVQTSANLNTLNVQNPKTFMNTEKASFRVDQP